MWGYSESASKNTSDPILKIRKERFLIFPLACDLVLALIMSLHLSLHVNDLINLRLDEYEYGTLFSLMQDSSVMTRMSL